MDKNSLSTDQQSYNTGSYQATKYQHNILKSNRSGSKVFHSQGCYLAYKSQQLIKSKRHLTN